MRCLVVIPAFNEERSIGRVVADVPCAWVHEVVVVDNASTDATAAVARAAGATVVEEPRRGYGNACLRGIAYARTRHPDVIVFLDGDYSDHPEELPSLIAPIHSGKADFVVGSRMRGARARGALLPQAIAGNWLACTLMRLIWGARWSDLGPFRAIRADALDRLGMQDRTFGWTIEMQIRALEAGLRCVEVPVSYRKRVGESKITGTFTGTLRASYKILWTIFRHAATRRLRQYGAGRDRAGSNG